MSTHDRNIIRVSGDNEHGAAARYSQQQAYVTLLTYLEVLTYLLTYLLNQVNLRKDAEWIINIK